MLAAWFSVWHPLRNVPVQTVKPNSNEWMGCRYRHDHSRICIVSVCAYGKLLRKKIKRLQKKPNQMVTLNKKKMNGILMFLAMLALGVLCYWFYYKCVDWFEKI